MKLLDKCTKCGQKVDEVKLHFTGSAIDFISLSGLRPFAEKRRDIEKGAFVKCFGEFLEEMEDLFGEGTVSSFTSDRSRSIDRVMKEMFAGVDHYFDNWHFIRNLVLEIVKNCTWYKFELIAECRHDELGDDFERSAASLSLHEKDHVKALNALLSVLSKGNRLEDIQRVSPFFATSAVESLNARAAFYATKDHFFSDIRFEIRTMLAAIDWNQKQFDELNGKREIISEKRYFNKTTKRHSKKYVKTPSDFTWRTEISEMATKVRKEGDPRSSTDVHMLTSDSFDDDDLWNSMKVVRDGDDDSDTNSTESIEEREVDALWDAMDLVSDTDSDNDDQDGLDIDSLIAEEEKIVYFQIIDTNASGFLVKESGAKPAYANATLTNDTFECEQCGHYLHFLPSHIAVHSDDATSATRILLDIFIERKTCSNAAYTKRRVSKAQLDN
ncbi:hypothetical protein CAEBREN_24862 [Caenorhabditis brenneri]|uniref:Uncharacterized protein n=1 Tax=Caenorhabditis brenneri TaxID=135651 RepID=G0NFL7_CAEBE|nr:hypothetical protein CAEBREN_24862 [Caenorhabditis brenneri]